MLKDEVKAVLARVASWPEERQQLLAELAVEIEAEMSNHPYQPSPDELIAIDEALTGEAADEEEINQAYDTFPRR